jgi:hypothetical protein
MTATVTPSTAADQRYNAEIPQSQMTEAEFDLLMKQLENKDVQLTIQTDEDTQEDAIPAL